MKKHHYHLIFATCITIAITGCSNFLPHRTHKTPKQTTIHYTQPTPEKFQKFQKVMKEIATSTLKDPKYNKIVLDTPEKKAWFKSLMYILWDRQITRDQFIAEGLKKYPTKRYEFTYVANGFQKYS